MAAIQPVTAFGSPINSAWIACMANSNNGQIVFMVGSRTLGDLPVTAGAFSPGCIAINQNGTSSTTNIFCNSGTAASPTWTVLTIS